MNSDDNDEILEMLKARLELGRECYGHGVRVEDDTTQWGTEKNDWEIIKFLKTSYIIKKEVESWICLARKK